MLCSYRNSSDRMVIVRVRGSNGWFLERVVFPFEIMSFHCPRGCEVEVVTRTSMGLEESEWVAAEELIAGEQEPSLEVSDEHGWRPFRSHRSLHVRGNASSVCVNYY